MLKLQITSLIFLLFFSMFVWKNSAYTATQGSLGTTSTGTVNISFEIKELVQINGLDDIVFPKWGGSGDLSQSDDACVFSNTANGTYNIKATGSGAAGAFTLSSGGNTIPYSLYWNNASGTDTGEQLITSPGDAGKLTGLQTNDPEDLDCVSSGGTNTRFRILFTDANLSAAVVATYTGSLTFEVNPE